MSLTYRRLGLAAVTVSCMAVVAACGEKNSYDAAEDALRDWLAAVEAGDEAACDLETSEYHEELVTENTDYDAQEITCEERVARMAALDDPFPASSSEMDVPVWDPSGEAIVEVTDARAGEVEVFSMIFENGGWLVSGDQPSSDRRRKF